MKRFIGLLLALFFFCACAAETPGDATVLSFRALPGDLFPFYCTDERDRLWRVENDGAFCLGVSVPSGENVFFHSIAAKDAALFACDLRTEAGVRLCSLAFVKGSGDVCVVAENVLASSLRASSAHNVLFCDVKNDLYLYNGQSALLLAQNVRQAEFLSADTCLYRSASGVYEDGEFLYPVFAAAADFNRYLTDAADIAAVDASAGRAYLIRGRHPVQKRTAQAETALCCVCDQTDVLFELPSVALSQFAQGAPGAYLLACDETTPTLSFRLYRVDGAEPQLAADGVREGRVVSGDGRSYVYEALREDIIERKLLTEGRAQALAGDTCPLSAYFVCGAHCYRLDGTTLYEDDVPLAASVAFCRASGDDLLCFHAAYPPYAVSLCRDGAVTLLAGDVADENWVWDGQTLWYNSRSADGLAVADTDGKQTAVLSRIDPGTAFLTAGRAAAAIKDGSLYLACEDQLVRPGLSVKRFLVNNG